MYKAFLTDALIYGGVDILWKFINFALFPLLAYFLSVEEFGTYILLNVVTWFALMLINCGLPVSLEWFYLRADSNSQEQKKIITASLTWITIWGAILIGSGLALSYLWRASFINFPWKLFAIALATAWPMALFQYLCYICRVNFSPWKFAGLQFLQNSLALGLGLGLVIGYNQGTEGLLWGSFLSFTVLLPFAYRWVVTSMGFDLSSLKPLLLFGIPFLINDLARWTYTLLDRFWLEQLGTLTDVGLFGMAFKLVTPLIFLISAFNLAWTPYALKEKPASPDFLNTSYTLWMWFLTGCALFLILFAQEVLYLLIPPPFWKAAPLVPPLAIGLVLLGSIQVTQVVLMQSDQTKKIALIAWIGGLFNCIGNFVFVPLWGAQGSALIVLATYGWIGIATYALARSSFVQLKPTIAMGAILCLGWGVAGWNWEGKCALLALFTLGALLLLRSRVIGYFSSNLRSTNGFAPLTTDITIRPL